MQHNLVLEGTAFRLRPVTLGDGTFIIELRSKDQERLRFIHQVGNDLKAQEEWLKKYFPRAGDYYWVVERRGSKYPEGTVSLYNLDETLKTAEWGRWVLRPGSLAAVESAKLIFTAAFEKLALDSTYCLTIASNTNVVSFHDSCGAVREKTLKNHFNLGGQKFDAVQHRVTRQKYPHILERLTFLSEKISRKILS